MTLRFPYRLFPRPQPVLSLGGRWVRPRPIIGVTVIGPSNTRVRIGLLDTGADDTVFSDNLAAVLGVDLTNAPTGEATTATMANAPVRYAQVILRITDGVEQREWQAWVGFTSAKLHMPLLGFAGFLQFFTATFHGDREQIELTVNSLYRGS